MVERQVVKEAMMLAEAMEEVVMEVVAKAASLVDLTATFLYPSCACEPLPVLHLQSDLLAVRLVSSAFELPRL